MKLNTEFILGMAKMEGGVKILLDINKVLNSEELEQMAEVAWSFFQIASFPLEIDARISEPFTASPSIETNSIEGGWHNRYRLERGIPASFSDIRLVI